MYFPIWDMTPKKHRLGANPYVEAIQQALAVSSLQHYYELA
jgi:hypothetical protein